MRLTRSVEVILGIAASGGVALMLSGSAFAAEGGAGTTTQTVVSGSVEHVSGNVISRDANHKAAVTVVTQADDPATLATSTDVSKTNSVQADTATNDNGPAMLAASSAMVATNPATPDPATQNGAKPAAVASAPAESSATPATPVTTQTASTSDTSVTFNSTLLVIQPKITATRPVVVEDLATLIPSAPTAQKSSDKAPAPSRPSGVFGKLTAELAASTVPSFYLMPTLSAAGLGVAVAVLVLVSLLALRSLVLTFGASLRQSGYAHAARSDVAGAMASPFFATPFRMGYVTAAGPSHSSFLMVADMKSVLSTIPNAFRKEDIR